MTESDMVIDALNDLLVAFERKGSNFDDGIAYWDDEAATFALCHCDPPLLVVWSGESDSKFKLLPRVYRIIKYRQRFGRYPSVELWKDL